MLKRYELLLLALLFVGVAGFSLDWALSGAIHHQKDVVVPDLVGHSVLESLDTLSAQNLGLKKEGAEHNDTVPAGTILRQNPSPGISVREGKIIRVTLSQGGESVYVPELVGQTMRAAEISLRSSFLSLGEVRVQPSLKFEKDIVVAQEPAPNAIVQKSALVHLTLSNGAPEDGAQLMPDFTGKSWSEVTAWSDEKKVRVEMTEETSDTAEPETVISQELAFDQTVPKNATLKFRVASRRSSGTKSESSSRKFVYEVPQGDTAREYMFVAVDGNGRKSELFKGAIDPGTKKTLNLPAGTTFPCRIRILVNGILTDERTVQ